MKKIMIGFILGGLVFGSIGVIAGTTLISSDKVSYKDTTADLALNDLFDNSLTGKNSIITALKNKGFSVSDNATYTDIVNGINELPVTLSKDEDNNIGYIKDGEDTVISFDRGLVDIEPVFLIPQKGTYTYEIDDLNKYKAIMVGYAGSGTTDNSPQNYLAAATISNFKVRSKIQIAGGGDIFVSDILSAGCFCVVSYVDDTHISVKYDSKNTTQMNRCLVYLF